MSSKSIPAKIQNHQGERCLCLDKRKRVQVKGAMPDDKILFPSGLKHKWTQAVHRALTGACWSNTIDVHKLISLRNVSFRLDRSYDPRGSLASSRHPSVSWGAKESILIRIQHKLHVDNVGSQLSAIMSSVLLHSTYSLYLRVMGWKHTETYILAQPSLAHHRKKKVAELRRLSKRCHVLYLKRMSLPQYLVLWLREKMVRYRRHWFPQTVVTKWNDLYRFEWKS